MTQLATLSPPSLETGSFGEDSLYEVVDGQRQEIPHMGAFEGVLASSLFFSMCRFAFEHNLGWVVSEVLFLLNEQRGLQRRPDVAFVSFGRWPDSEIPSENAWDVIPNLAVEVVSPSNLAGEIETKIVDYFESGVELVWVIHPRAGRVYVHHSRDKCEVVERGGELTGGSVLPGFRLAVDWLFESVKRPNLAPKLN